MQVAYNPIAIGIVRSAKDSMLTGSVERSHGPSCRQKFVSIHCVLAIGSSQLLQRKRGGHVPTGAGHFLPRRDILTDGGGELGGCEGWWMDELDFCWAGGR